MNHKKKSNDRYKPEELKRLLHSYWLVSDHGIMAAGIEQVVMAYFEGKRIVLVLQKSAHAETIANTLMTLGLHYGDETVNSYRELRAFTHSTKGLSNNVAILKVPALADRVEDFELLLPFAYELALRELNSEQGQRIASIEGGFILSALVLLKFGRYRLREVVRDALGCKEDGVIWGAGNLGIRADKTDVSEFVRDIPPAAGAYLGLGRKGSHEERYPRNAEELYPAEEMKQVFNSAIGGSAQFTYPRLHCPVRLEPEHLGLVARNFAFWYRERVSGMMNPALYSLKLRLWGIPEDEIHKAVIDGNTAEYEGFLAENHIGLASRESRDVLEEWDEARELLFVKDKSLAVDPVLLITDDNRSGSALNTHEQFSRQVQVSDLPVVEENVETIASRVELKSGGRIVSCRHGELDFTKRQAKIVSVYFDNYIRGNDYLLEQDALEDADDKMSSSSFCNLFRSRQANFRFLFENHPTQKDLWRFKSDL